jgi:hypothetical protein
VAKPKAALAANSLDHETAFHTSGRVAHVATAVFGGAAGGMFRRLAGDADDGHGQQQSVM